MGAPTAHSRDMPQYRLILDLLKGQGASLLWRHRCDLALSDEVWISVSLNSEPVLSLTACEFRVGGRECSSSLEGKDLPRGAR